MIKRIFSALLCLLMVMGMLSGCGSKEPEGAALLSFSQAQSVQQMEKLNGKTVTIIGYMSTLSPISGQFMYLMNLPYQSCPFCVPNTTQLSNTMAVYAPDGKSFEFTDRAIQVTGIMEFGNYTDEFGYEYTYRIVDASYSILNSEDMSPQLKLWQQLAASDVIGEIYAMYEYVNFLCFWPTYTASFSVGKDYLYPSDALRFIETEGYQFHYGYVEGYFDKIVATVEAVDATAFADLVKNIRDAEKLAEEALAELRAGNYTSVPEYSDAFGDGRSQFQMNNAKRLESEMQRVYTDFSQWLSGWEL